MDCASKRITQGHRILKPKQVRREILIPSLPFHIRSKHRETLRLNAAYTASKTQPLERQRSKHLSFLITDLPIEYQYFKSYKMENSFGSFSSSCFNIE